MSCTWEMTACCHTPDSSSAQLVRNVAVVSASARMTTSRCRRPAYSVKQVRPLSGGTCYHLLQFPTACSILVTIAPTLISATVDPLVRTLSVNASTASFRKAEHVQRSDTMVDWTNQRHFNLRLQETIEQLIPAVMASGPNMWWSKVRCLQITSENI